MYYQQATMTEQKLVLYNTEWQILRVNLLKTNRTDGGWTTLEGTEANIATLKAYLEQFTEDNNLRHAALWRVTNALNAVRMGYSGQGLKGSPQDGYVQMWRDSWSSQYWTLKRSLKVRLPSLGGVSLEAYRERTRQELLEASDVELLKVHTDLSRRAKLHPGRLELEWYIELLCERLGFLYVRST